jgi:ATP-dependent RNA helicase DDX46/PRP5
MQKPTVLQTGEHFADELEINDFPQQARWKVTHKDALAAITEWTGAAVTTRGSYIPPGRNPSLGERKLYLFIEAPDLSSVKKAKTEIMKILEEATVNAAPEKDKYGKYKVV